MNALLLWFHRTGSPPHFDRFTARWMPWCFDAMPRSTSSNCVIGGGTPIFLG